MSLLEISGLTVTLAGATRPVLRGVDLAVAPGEIHGLIGESGAGKSMLARSLLGLLPAGARIEGRLRFEGLDLAGPVDRRALARRLALVPQASMSSLNPVRRVGVQMAEVLRFQHRLGHAEARSRVAAMLAEVGIVEPERTMTLYPHELSGGMRQRCLIALAFAGGPRLVVADEPTTGLDVTVQRQILRLIKAVQAAHGTAVLFVTHDLGVVAKLCDQVTVLFGGRVLEQAATPKLLANPRHPYTRALLDAAPRYDRPDRPLKAVPAALLRELADG